MKLNSRKGLREEKCSE